MTNMDSELENEDYLKLLQQDKNPVMEPMQYAIVERNTTNPKIWTMVPSISLHTSANRRQTSALNIDSTQEQLARLWKVNCKPLAKFAKGLQKVHLRGDQENSADGIAARNAGLQQVLRHLNEE